MGTIFLIPFIIAAVLKYLHYKGNKKVVDFFETEKGEKVRIGLWIYFWVFVIFTTLLEAFNTGYF